MHACRRPRHDARRDPVAPGAERLFGRWWRRQSPARQDRFATLGPLVSVLLFLAAIISAFWYLRNEEFERETESVKRDTEIAQQQIRLRLIENQEQLVRMARELVTRAHRPRRVPRRRPSSFTRERPEITHLIWVGAKRAARRPATRRPCFHARGQPQRRANAGPSLPVDGAAQRARDGVPAGARRCASRSTRAPFSDASGTPVFQVHVPLIERGAFAGALIAEYSIERAAALLRAAGGDAAATRSRVLDASGRVLASTRDCRCPASRAAAPPIVHDVPLAPAGNGLVLRGQG